MPHLDGSFPLTETLRAAARWRSAALILATAIIGVLAGWVFLLSHPPVYEAQVVLGVQIDLSHTGELTVNEEDHALGVVDALIASTQVHEKVAAAALAEGIDTNLQDLAGRLVAERLFGDWRLRVRHEDAYTAGRLADLWGSAAYETLQAAGGYARQVDALYHQDDSDENCFKGSPVQPVHAYCGPQTLALIESGNHSKSEVVHSKKQASQGVLTGMSFFLTRTAQIQPRPVLYDPAPSIAASALAAALIAAALLFFWEARSEPVG